MTNRDVLAQLLAAARLNIGAAEAAAAQEGEHALSAELHEMAARLQVVHLDVVFDRGVTPA